MCDHVYFQPGDNITLSYPCIIYNEDDEDTEYAGNLPYRTTVRYMVTVIDRDPLSTIRPKVRALPMCSFNRRYTADNLNHFVYNLYF